MMSAENPTANDHGAPLILADTLFVSVEGCLPESEGFLPLCISNNRSEKDIIIIDGIESIRFSFVPGKEDLIKGRYFLMFPRVNNIEDPSFFYQGNQYDYAYGKFSYACSSSARLSTSWNPKICFIGDKEESCFIKCVSIFEPGKSNTVYDEEE